MISGDLFFLALKLHRLGLSVDLTLIYHNVFLRAPRKRPQGVSDGKPVKQATTPPKTRQKRT
ncbi:hypothetical protein GFC04_26050 [Klebsiella quasipneumoniae]|nr:hypothetical protein [Klebsiella quasipneumoniae]